MTTYRVVVYQGKFEDEDKVDLIDFNVNVDNSSQGLVNPLPPRPLKRLSEQQKSEILEELGDYFQATSAIRFALFDIPDIPADIEDVA